VKAAIIVIDMVNDFVTGSLKCERAPRIIPNIKRLLDLARRGGAPVIYASDAHLPGVDRELQLWPSHAVAGTRGAEVVEELRPRGGDHVLTKRRYSAFYGTGLDALLRDLGVGTLVLTGLVTNVCVQHTAADAFFRGYRLIVPEDCVEAPTEEAQRSSLDYMRSTYGCEVTTSRKLMERGLVEG